MNKGKKKLKKCEKVIKDVKCKKSCKVVKS